ncbi:uncharacterized protein LOC110727199 [Chenopodium quinoa]|uniref:DCD domain-containing protein n=1 Tax=Chenopodium quinoa TaxID=63459 RepID=A0A803MZI3_CHEQI|nr:uncharacterized protein LOC110727199 [Chenopodium quinoa]XP_021762452.1 uncharacterized protein LOC110727199 [Chenopodium quinoa]
MQLNNLEDVSATSQHSVSDNTNTSDKEQNAKAVVEHQIAGYIFMCNAATKPDCFIYRVFGLPASRMKFVEKIKPNTKLFLFDVDVRLLYGLYSATSSGMMVLEPCAFGGKFPAQVKFSIARECLPLPEVAFKDVIKENYYSKFKFKQELNDEQVNKLVSLLRPMTVSSPKRPSLEFLDGVRTVYQKYVGPSLQVTRHTNMDHERSVLGVPQAAYANSYGQKPISHCTISPVSPAVAPSSTLPSSLQASQWVAIAAESLNAEDRNSSLTLNPSDVPVVSPAAHAHVIQ